MICIDGSVLEGGGQIIRMALSFSALTKTPIKIINIRKGRQKGGLGAQHLKGVELLQQISNAKVKGANIGSTEIEFIPGKLKGGKYFADILTAGSIALLVQIALPVAYFCASEVILDLKGGTNAEMAPQIDFVTEILRPNIEKFGGSFDFDLFKRGYYPKGGGHCVVTVKPIVQLHSVELVKLGEVTKIFGWSFVGRLPLQMAQEMTAGAESEFKRLKTSSYPNIETYKEAPEMVFGNCAGIILGCSTSTKCIIGGSGLGSKRETSFATGANAAKSVIKCINIGACVDQYVQDQLIIFMTLAKGKSRIRTEPLTLHTKTAIYVAELLTKVKFNIIEDNETVIIECDGIGLENTFSY